MRGPRSDRVNERYYARRQHPNFRQFGNQYHYTDEQGRQYRLAVANNEVFQNYTLQTRPGGGPGNAPRRCDIDQQGDIKLYVRLPTPQHQWYTQQEMSSELLLEPRAGHDTRIVRLRSAYKDKERVGVVTVQGLDEYDCNELLNK